MSKYEVIIYWSKEDKSSIAEVPELPGCAADGPTKQAALKNVDTVIGRLVCLSEAVIERIAMIRVESITSDSSVRLT